MLGLENRDIPVSKYEVLKDILKIEDKVEFRFTDEIKDNIISKK